MPTIKRLKPWMLVSAAWILPTAFAVINRVAQGRLGGWGPATPRDLLWEGGDWLLYAFLTPAVFAISRRWPLSRELRWQRAALHLGMALAFCVAWASAGKLFQLSLGLAFTPAEIQKGIADAGDHLVSFVVRDWLSWTFITLPFGTGVYLCMVGIEHATRYFVESNERAVQVSVLSAQLADARLSSLQAQLNPHFLFNALNTINVFVRDGDTATATRVIEQLSELLRKTLNRSRGIEVRLEEEVDLVRDYLAVEVARFSDRLRPEILIDATLDAAAVPSFLIQHLVENAIRHGIAHRSGSGVVRVHVHRDGEFLEIVVRDDGAGLSHGVARRPGLGLDNTRERLRTLYGARGSLELTSVRPFGTEARVRLPYRKLGPEGAHDVT